MHADKMSLQRLEQVLQIHCREQERPRHGLEEPHSYDAVSQLSKS